MAWSLVTYFVVSVIIIEDQRVIASIKESAQLFKKTWGESIVGSGSIGLIFMIIGLITFIPLFFLLFSGNSILVIGGIICYIFFIMILTIISLALQGIYTTALYL